MHGGPGRRAILLVILGALVGLPASAADDHVDCHAGRDDDDGRSPGTAWRTLAKASAAPLSPGDSILLKRGTRCTGMLWPKGSGEPSQPLRLAAYGTGPLPIVDAAGGEAAVKLFDQQHWHIETIEATGGNPYGIHISGRRGTLRHFRVRNVVVHDVGGEVKAKTSGLLVVAAGGGGQTFEDVVIDGVTAYATTQWAGILVHGAASADKDLQHNFGHDAMGYCASVFAASGETTTNSTVRDNVCVNNGRSPKLARRQGDLFISTWEGGKLDGVRIHSNSFYWNPPIDAPAVQMDHADFTGTRSNVFQSNLVLSTVPRLIHSNDFFLQSALEQFGERGLVVAVGFHGGASGQLRHDWNLGAIRTFEPVSPGVAEYPTTLLIAPDGKVVRRWAGLAPPADLGLTLRALLGPPAGSPAVDLARDGE